MKLFTCALNFIDNTNNIINNIDGSGNNEGKPITPSNGNSNNAELFDDRKNESATAPNFNNIHNSVLSEYIRFQFCFKYTFSS